MTLTQLHTFVLVARLGTVRAAAEALGVTDSAVSQALSVLRKHLDDPLVVRVEGRMEPTPAGVRLLGLASQMVALGAEAEAAVRTAQGRAEELRVVTTSVTAEFVAGPVTAAFDARGGGFDVSTGVASTAELEVLVANRLADVALGPALGADPGLRLASEPVLRTQLVAVAAPGLRLAGRPAGWPWLADPSAGDPDSETSELLRRLGVPEDRVRVFGSHAGAWDTAVAGGGVAVATAHLVNPQVRRGDLRVVPTPATPLAGAWHATTLRPELRGAGAAAFLRFLTTPEAMALMRSPHGGVVPSRFRPPVYVTIWN
ncbi:LysR family transcriptional regulator [Actinomycetospora straminea]|uniref:LysR family transcriptional regulator n=1 Tax=Actinomycetospora straminea TaxID=663607 RepID=UPI002366BCA0|nr:LysR family transcriptional regulator [Actinomycetospora straminea]MDD7932441.1 LysR family transcriptional regulator [Actinomycetospora straminea]